MQKWKPGSCKLVPMNFQRHCLYLSVPALNNLRIVCPVSHSVKKYKCLAKKMMAEWRINH